LYVSSAYVSPSGEEDRNQWETWEDLKKLATEIVIVHGQHNTVACAELYNTGEAIYEHLNERRADVYVNMSKDDTVTLGAAFSRAQAKQRKDNWVEDLKFVHQMWWMDSNQQAEHFGKLLAARK
jgi:hypothetical protein